MCDLAPAVQINFVQPRQRDARADARAGRDGCGRRGARARARPGVRELRRAASRGARRARGGAGVMTLESSPGSRRNWSDPSAIGLDGYVAAGGYAGLRQALGMADADIVELVKTSGLRGRGGAGFPTGHEVGVRAARHRQAHLRRRELRRVRARHVQQPRARRARAAPAARGHGDRRPRDRVRDGLRLRARRVPVAVDRAAARDRGGLRRRVPRRRRRSDRA